MGLLLVVAGPIAAEALAEEEVVEVHGAIDHRRRVSPGRPTAATRVNHVWTWGFIHDRTEDGRALKILTVMDEYSRFNLCLHVSRSITAEQVIEQLELAMVYGKPDFVRSDNGPEFIATAISAHLNKKQIGIIYIAPGSPWENPYVESFLHPAA